MKKNEFIIIIICVLYLISILFSWSVAKRNFNSDLRNRIVGARIVEINEDPYHFISNNKLPDKFIDPLTSPYSIVTRLTIPPPLVILHIPFAAFPYTTIKILWFIIEWLLFLSTIYLVQTLTRDKNRKIFILVLGLLFSYSYSWYLHIVVGQIYIFYAALISLSVWLYKVKDNALGAGIIISIAVIFRPPLLIVLLPFLFFNNKLAKKTKTFLSSFLVSFLLTLGVCYIFTPNLWNSYLKSIIFARTLFPMTSSERQFDPQAYYPKTVEGTPFLNHSSSILIEDSSLKGIAGKKLHIDMSNIYLYFIFALTIILLIKLIKITSNYKFVYLFISGTALMIIGEYFIPAARYSYYDIQLFVPLAILFVHFNKTYKYCITIAVLLASGYVFSTISSILLTIFLSLHTVRILYKRYNT